MMKRMDEGKVSLVEFLSSIQFDRRNTARKQQASGKRFARLDQHAPVNQQFGKEENYLIRSAN
jgi:hypothetical protein